MKAHALVAYHTKAADPVHKITIIPRGRALGIIAQIPKLNVIIILNHICYVDRCLNGGRCAEKLIFLILQPAPVTILKLLRI